MCRLDAFDARDAIVDGDDQGRPAFCRERHDPRCQAVAESKTVGHEEVDVGEAEGAHRPDQER